MVGPVPTLALLTTVLGEFAEAAGAESNIGDETVRITWVLSLLRPRIVHFEAPAAVLGHAEHVNDGDERFTLHNRLSNISTLDGSRSDELSLSLSSESGHSCLIRAG